MTSEEFAAQVADAVNDRDLGAIAELLHPDAEFHSAIAASEGRIYEGGVDGIRRYFEDVGSVWVDFRIDLENVHDLDSRLLVEYRTTGRSHSGVPLDQHVWQVWTFRDGLLWRNQSYTSRGEALKVAGLSE